MSTAVTLFLICLPNMYVCLVYTFLLILGNGVLLSYTLEEVLLARKPVIIHHFLLKKMIVPYQEYDRCCPLVL